MIVTPEIEVSVFDGPLLVQKWPCSAITMPDGSTGVIWRGTPYTLLPGNRIDVGSAPAGSASSHVVISGEEASWVLIQGAATALRESESALRSTGIIVSRSGRWLGEPVGGVAFDWYLRFDGPLDTSVIASLLSRTAPSARASISEAQSLVLEQRIASLLVDVARLKQAARRDVMPPSPELEDRDLAQADYASDAIAALDEAKARLAEADAELARLRAGRPAPAPASKLMGELCLAFQALRPDLVLLRGSLTVAVGEYPSRAGFYRAIQELLSSGARPEGWKMLRGADRWWERHVSTGQDDTGRLYARFDTDRRQWSLLLGWKGDQAADIAWLRRT